MSGFRFLHAADLHIDSPLRGLEADAPAERIRTATRMAYTNLVDLALREQVAFVVIAGDLFDGEWQDWRTGQFFAQDTVRLTRAGIRVIAIRGNHDADSVISRRLALPEGASVLATERAESCHLVEHDVWIHGQSFAKREVTENLARSYPEPQAGFNIGLLHTAASGRPGHASYAPCSAPQLAAHGYEYWALGHVHTREVLSRAPWIVFPGNIQGRHINEPGPKGATLVTVQEGQVANVVHHDLDTVRWAVVTVDVSGATEIDQVLATLRARMAEALEGAAGRLLAVRLVVTGACAAHPALARDPGATREILVAETGAIAPTDELWIESVQLRTSPSVELDSIRARTDAVGLLVRSIDAASGGSLPETVKKYCDTMLNRAHGLRAALGEAHPAVQAAGGTLPDDILARARTLVLARLAEGA